LTIGLGSGFLYVENSGQKLLVGISVFQLDVNRASVVNDVDLQRLSVPPCDGTHLLCGSFELRSVIKRHCHCAYGLGKALGTYELQAEERTTLRLDKPSRVDSKGSLLLFKSGQNGIVVENLL